MEDAIAAAFPIELGWRKVAIRVQAHTGAWGQSNRNKGAPGRTTDGWMKMNHQVGLHAAR